MELRGWMEGKGWTSKREMSSFRIFRIETNNFLSLFDRLSEMYSFAIFIRDAEK